MSSSKTIVVLGATGNQGGSVVNTYLQSPEWKVRGITRNVNSEKSKKLASHGVEVVSADLNDLHSLEKAFIGANAIFIVSDFWGIYGDPANREKPAQGQPLNLWAAQTEKQQLLNAIKAASEVSTLERLVVSALPNCSKWSKGKYTHIYHFDFKAQAVEEAAKIYPDLWSKTSVFNAGWFMSNYTSNPLIQPRREEGVVKFTGAIKADLKLPLFVADEDTGPLVKALFENAPGKNLIAYREWMTLEEMISTFSKITGLPAKYVYVEDREANLPMPEELKAELRDNWKCFNECGYEAREDPTIIHPTQLESAPKLGTIADWIKKQNWESLN